MLCAVFGHPKIRKKAKNTAGVPNGVLPVKNEVHLLGPTSNVFWINEIKEVFKLWLFPEKSHSSNGPTRIATFMVYKRLPLLCDTQRSSHATFGIETSYDLLGAPIFDCPPNAWSGSATGSESRETVVLSSLLGWFTQSLHGQRQIKDIKQ